MKINSSRFFRYYQLTTTKFVSNFIGYIDKLIYIERKKNLMYSVILESIETKILTLDINLFCYFIVIWHFIKSIHRLTVLLWNRVFQSLRSMNLFLHLVDGNHVVFSIYL